MSWLYLVILSNFLFAVVFALDKVLVKKIVSPLKYALIVGAFEGLKAVWVIKILHLTGNLNKCIISNYNERLIVSNKEQLIVL